MSERRRLPMPDDDDPEIDQGAAPRALTASPGGRRSRRAAARSRGRRRRLLVAGAALVAVLLVVVVAVVLLRPAEQAGPVTVEQVRTQRTLLVQLRGADGQAVQSAMLAFDPAARAETSSTELLLVPSRVLAQVPGSGTIPFGQVLRLPDEALSRAAFSDLVGITVDGGWVLGLDAFAALLDQVGGVVVDVDVDVTVARPDGTSVVVVAAGGGQRLSGAQAVAFTTFQRQGEQEVSRLPRLQKVLQGLLLALPTDRGALTSLLGSLGAGSTLSQPPSEVATLLGGAAGAQRDGRLSVDSLPVVPVDTGGPALAYRVDAKPVRALVDLRLSGSRPASARADSPRVLVLNGVGTPGLGTAARTLLVGAGLAFAGSSNAGRLDYATSVVLVPDATAPSRRLGERVASALRLPASSVRVERIGQTVAEAVVILGADFTPPAA